MVKKHQSEEQLKLALLASAKVKEIRRDKKLSQEEVAQILNLSPNTVSNKERGLSDWSLFDVLMLVKIAEHPLKVIKDFLNGKRTLSLTAEDIQNAFAPKTPIKKEAGDD